MSAMLAPYAIGLLAGFLLALGVNGWWARQRKRHQRLAVERARREAAKQSTYAFVPPVGPCVACSNDYCMCPCETCVAAQRQRAEYLARARS